MSRLPQDQEAGELFNEAPVVPVSTGAAAYDPIPSTSGPSGFGGVPYHQSTIDEPLTETFKRDITRIGQNLRIVLFPFYVGKERTKALRNWDLWGPLVFVLIFAVVLVTNTKQNTKLVFPVVFSTLTVGSIILTVNIVLLGGTIVFFQSLCLLGYCLFPLDVAAIIAAASKGNMIVRGIAVVLALAWSTYASVPFVAESVPITRRSLAVYPVMLLYMCTGWMIFIM